MEKPPSDSLLFAASQRFSKLASNRGYCFSELANFARKVAQLYLSNNILFVTGFVYKSSEHPILETLQIFVSRRCKNDPKW
jgi:hypothetical protein